MLLSVLALATALASVQVPVRDVLVTDISGHVRIVRSSGKLVRRLPWTMGRQVQAIELAPDRRHAFVSLYRSERPPELFRVDLATGAKSKLADAISPALSPDKTRLAYVNVELRSDIKYRTAVTIRNLRTGALLRLPLAPKVPLGTPPELVINWSPDRRQLALFDGSRIRIVDSENGSDIPMKAPHPPGEFAPVFVDRNTLVVQAGCCIGPQRLVAVDLRSGARTPFATLSSPVEQVRRVRSGRLLVVTALRGLAVVSRGHVRTIARSVVAAAT